MATVITNLLSAIPIFGQDFVQSDKTIEFFTLNILLNETNLSLLPTIGTVSIHALKKEKKIRLDFIEQRKKEYLYIPYQFIAFLVGLIDGDGYIRINKTTKGYIAINLIIGLSLEDISTLNYINSVIKLGKITKNLDHKNPNCRLIINRTDLQEVLFPLLLHHNIFFLTETRRAQFDLAMFIFNNEIKFYNDIPMNNFTTFVNKGFVPMDKGNQRDCYSYTKKNSYIKNTEGSNIIEIPSTFLLPKLALDYVNLPFFKN